MPDLRINTEDFNDPWRAHNNAKDKGNTSGHILDSRAGNNQAQDMQSPMTVIVALVPMMTTKTFIQQCLLHNPLSPSLLILLLVSRHPSTLHLPVTRARSSRIFLPVTRARSSCIFLQVARAQSSRIVLPVARAQSSHISLPVIKELTCQYMSKAPLMLRFQKSAHTQMWEAQMDQDLNDRPGKCLKPLFGPAKRQALLLVHPLAHGHRHARQSLQL